MFCHLRIHSEYSLSEGIVKISDMVAAVRSDQGMSAVALTDINNVYAAVKFYRAALASGVQPILGAEVTVTHANGGFGQVVMLCCHWDGFVQLSKLLTRAHQEGNQVSIEASWLEPESTDGLIVLSGGWQSDLIRAWSKGDHAAADTYLHFWSKLLPNRYYLEVHRIGVADEVSFIQQTLSFSTAFKLPVVATNPVCFMAKDDFEAHQARVCIHRGEVLAQASGTHTQSQYLVSSAKMTTLFADMPAALENSVAIAKRCACILPLDTLNMPRFSNESEADIAKRLVRDANLGLNKLIADLAPSYQQRLDFELKMIAKMGFASYFLIVADFIKWAKDNGIPVGPGRGSGVGSMVAYGLGITALDPIEHGLLFERFLNPERVSMPDFDIDKAA